MKDAAVIERRRAHERAEIREALAMSRARESIDRLLGEELIAAARAVVMLRPEVAMEWDCRTQTARRSRLRLIKAIDRLEELVGKP